MADKVLLSVSNNEGYAADQIDNSMTLRDLYQAIEEAMETYGEDCMIVTKDTGNRYGANFGKIDIYEDTFRSVHGDDDEDEDDE